ncbi:MAG: hypothetical protein IJF75_02470 [Clostridia bacterium]|nr:hypothetical protein [Clostridia bacterium]
MKLNKKLQNIANESLEIYNNEEFLTELLNMVKTPVIIEKPFKLNKAVVSGVALGLVLVVAVPVIIRAATGLNQTEVPKSTSAQTSNSTQYAPSPAPTDSDTSFSTSTSNNIQNGEASPWLYMSVKSDDYTFNLNDVTLTLFYGTPILDPEFEKENGLDVPNFDIYFKNNEGNEILYKHVEENLISFKYNSEIIIEKIDRNNLKIVGVKYDHSEEIRIPKEIFTKNEGTVSVAINGYLVKSNVYVMLNELVFDYIVVDNQVTLALRKYSWIHDAIE